MLISEDLPYQVINTDTADKPGVHWLALYTTKKRAYVFDSFGRSITHLVHLLTDSLKKHGFLLGATDLARHPEQRGFTSEVCGQAVFRFYLSCVTWE